MADAAQPELGKATSSNVLMGAMVSTESFDTAGIVVSGAPTKLSTVSQDEDGDERKEDEVMLPSKKLLFLLCAVGGLEGADGVLLPCVFFALQEDLGLTLNNLAAMSLVQALAGNLAAPVWGTLADRGLMTRKAIIVLGCVLQGLITVVLSAVDNLLPMVMLRALNGAMLASLRPIANGIVADVTTETSRGKVFGAMQLTMNVGTMAGTLVGTNIARRTIVGIQGWRVAFLIIGGVSVLVGAVAGALMEEPPHRGLQQKQEGLDKKEAAKDELQKLLRYFRMPSFCVLVLQGCFGSIPWNALGYSTLFFQVGGITDFQASVIAICGQISGSIGSILGGVISDAMVKCTPMHGRAITAQISVFSGIPIAWLIFMTTPPDGGAFPYYLVLMIVLGILATWCGTAVNLPILSELVEPGNRATIMAWEGTLEGSCSAIFGNAMVGFLAQNIFGYHLDSASDNVKSDPENVHALGSALMLVSFCPWMLCFAFYTLLHWSYPRDMARLQAARAPKQKSSAELLHCLGAATPGHAMADNPDCSMDGNPDCSMDENPSFSMDDGNPDCSTGGNPKADCFGAASPSRPRLSANAARAPCDAASPRASGCSGGSGSAPKAST